MEQHLFTMRVSLQMQGADYSGVLVDVASSERSLTTTQAVEIAHASPIPTVIATLQ